MARHRTPNAPALCTVRRVIESGRERNWFQRYGRHVAFKLRHEAGSVQRGHGAALETSAAAVPCVAHVCAVEAFGKIWASGRSARWTHSGASVKESVGTGVGQRLFAHGTA